ncbi:zinc-ribbon domain-containing protein [Paludibaculum fermentans]|uniref:Zinc-ribbon domain-containing protein n=1 Tax=Paludibaculum fermentans TaxID=1473598 RepID=A0A7S7NKA1_PALFE|nr:zinc-ribbon domain-containing protein [Paludibaculum fermentans]QOY85152.1 zinc-ribbon domain-containing protein [Paludibaculum fermentans]
MPFCTQCGTEVQPADIFCGSCGARQAHAAGAPGPTSRPATPPPPHNPANDFLKNLTSRNASLMCYIPVAGWIISIIILASDRFRAEREVRFHAFQGLYLFVLWLFVDWVFAPFSYSIEAPHYIAKALKAVVFGAWIFMMVKTSQGDNFRLPILGELADRSVSEQK